MTSWTAVALALSEPGDDAMVSRLPIYLHPLAGRPLIWHMLSELVSLRPVPPQLILLARPDLPGELFRDISDALRIVYAEDDDLRGSLETAGALPEGRVLLVDAAAPALGPALQARIEQPPEWTIPAAGGGVAAALLSADRALELLSAGGSLSALPPAGAQAEDEAAALVVRDRASLADAVRLIRDRLVAQLMKGGVTFLLPESVLVDVDVRIGRDSIIYPGAVIEGQTSIGSETVVGPGCRIVDAQVGSGVELKGWNYVSRTAIRNRAILEPYVRRGFD